MCLDRWLLTPRKTIIPMSSIPWSCSQQKCDFIASVNHTWPSKTVNNEAFNKPIVIQAFNRTTFDQAFKKIDVIQALYGLLSFKHTTAYCHSSFQKSYWHSNIQETSCHSSIQYRTENYAFNRLLSFRPLTWFLFFRHSMAHSLSSFQ